MHFYYNCHISFLHKYGTNSFFPVLLRKQVVHLLYMLVCYVTTYICLEPTVHVESLDIVSHSSEWEGVSKLFTGIVYSSRSVLM